MGWGYSVALAAGGAFLAGLVFFGGGGIQPEEVPVIRESKSVMGKKEVLYPAGPQKSEFPECELATQDCETILGDLSVQGERESEPSRNKRYDEHWCELSELDESEMIFFEEDVEKLAQLYGRFTYKSTEVYRTYSEEALRELANEGDLLAMKLLYVSAPMGEGHLDRKNKILLAAISYGSIAAIKDYAQLNLAAVLSMPNEDFVEGDISKGVFAALVVFKAAEMAGDPRATGLALRLVEKFKVDVNDEFNEELAGQAEDFLEKNYAIKSSSLVIEREEFIAKSKGAKYYLNRVSKRNADVASDRNWAVSKRSQYRMAGC